MEPERLREILEPIRRRGGRIYAVGGAVRDRILGRPVSDTDLVIAGVPFDDLVRALRRLGRVNPVGKSFGVIKFRPHGEPDHEIDIALPRRETSTGAGHRDFHVDFDHRLPVEEDLGRRDFTINAMAFDISTRTLVDPFHGQEDLRNGILRIVFPGSFEEDPLRMLRAVQFAARFRCRADPTSLESLRSNAHRIATVSRERITEEVRKLFESAEVPSTGLELLRDGRLLDHLFMEIRDADRIPAPPPSPMNLWRYLLRLVDSLRSMLPLRLAGLFSELGRTETQAASPADAARLFRRVAERDLRLSTRDEDAAAAIIAGSDLCPADLPDGTAIRRAIHEGRLDHLAEILDLSEAKFRARDDPAREEWPALRRRFQDETKRQIYTLKDLEIGGEDLMALGLAPGPRMGDILGRLHREVIDDPGRNSREYLAARAREIIAGSG